MATGQLGIWLFNICFTVMFSALFLKVYRVWRVIANPKMRKIKITERDLGQHSITS